MKSAVTLPGVGESRKGWDFAKTPGFPGGFALTLAEYAYARMHTPVVTYEKEVTWLTVHNELIVLSDFARYCSRNLMQSFDEIDKHYFEKYLRHLRFSASTEEKSEDRISFIVRIIYRLWDYRTTVTRGFKEIPFGKSHLRLLKAAPRESDGNLTPVIPENIYSALISAALDYILIYSSTIIPVWNELNVFWQAELSSSDFSKRQKERRLYKRAARALSHNPAGWRGADWKSINDLYAELQQLRAACAIIILAFSGIRVSELLSIQADCCVTEQYEDGCVRHYINTAIHKHREGGTKDTWVVIEEVVKAIKILEILTAKIRKATNDNHLFLSVGTCHFFNVQKEYSSNSVAEYTTCGINYQINSFQRHCNQVINRPIPKWINIENQTTESWSFNTRHFRRTLARYIARLPFGIIAGMRQYKHVEVAVFEGYAGSEPEWNKLLEDERVLASIDLLEEVAMDLSNGELAGHVGQQIKSEFAIEFKGRAEDFPPSQIAKWLATSQKPLFVGKFNFCFFDSAKAVCTGAASVVPVLNHCQPDVCSNACLAKRHMPIWEAQLKQAEDIATHPKVSQLHRKTLMHEVIKLRAVVENYGAKK